MLPETQKVLDDPAVHDEVKFMLVRMLAFYSTLRSKRAAHTAWAHVRFLREALPACR